MQKKDALPTIQKKEKINITHFTLLAGRVKKILEEEKEYLQQNENNNSRGLLSNS